MPWRKLGISLGTGGETDGADTPRNGVLQPFAPDGIRIAAGRAWHPGHIGAATPRAFSAKDW